MNGLYMLEDFFEQRVKNAQRDYFVQRHFCTKGHFCTRATKKDKIKIDKKYKIKF